MDAAEEATVDVACDRVEAEPGPIEAWVNVAFVGSLAYFWDTEPDEYRRTTEVTYSGRVFGVRAALRVISRGTAAGSRTCPPRWPPRRSRCSRRTVGAKEAVRAMTDSVLTELRATGSNVTSGR